jgi:hypothetical protein
MPDLQEARDAVVEAFTQLCADPDDETVARRADDALSAVDEAFAKIGVHDAAQLPET